MEWAGFNLSNEHNGKSHLSHIDLFNLHLIFLGVHISKNQLSARAASHHQQNMANKFCLEDYDAIGFDLDNTLATYNLKNLLEMEYKCLAEYLIEHKGYKEEALLKPFDEESTDFLQRGKWEAFFYLIKGLWPALIKNSKSPSIR